MAGSRPTLSASLPSAFRLAWSPRGGSSAAARSPRSFYARSHDLAELPAPAVDSALAKTRLEILSGWEVNFAVLCLYSVSFLAFIYVLITLHAFAVEWQANHDVLPMSRVEQVFRWLLQTASFLLPIFFVLNLILHGSVTDEQIWTCVLLAVGLLATNPLMRDVLVFDAQHMVRPPVVRPHMVWNEALYTAVVYLYLLLAAHSYRVFEVNKIHSLAFYAPKFAIALVYFLVKVVAGFKADLSLGLVPYSRVLTWYYLLTTGRATMRVTVPVMITTVLDTAFGFWLVKQVALTADVLATVPYVENRTKQLGFRCFVYQTLAFCFNMIGLSMLITYLLPRSFIYATFDDPYQHFFQLEPPVARLALAFVYFTWTLVLAYVNLPPKPLVPFAQDVIARCLYLIRNSPVAVWLGLADIVNTEDAEDSSVDEDPDSNPQHSQASFASRHPAILNSKSNVPFLYRHRELYHLPVFSPQFANPISPLMLTELSPHQSSNLDTFRLHSQDNASADSSQHLSDNQVESHSQKPEPEEPLTIPSTSPASPPAPVRLHFAKNRPFFSPHMTTNNVPQTPPPRRIDTTMTPLPNVNRRARSVNHPVLSSRREFFNTSQEKRRLRMRKNLFVMQTQVVLANAAYLAYIPGNNKEELVEKKSSRQESGRLRSPSLHTGSLANDLDDLARQIEEENRDLQAAQHTATDESEEEDCEMQPDFDDGSFFRVDPYATAEKYGYKLYRHISNEELNTHAIVLISSTRVIVAFSGTRNVQNWGVNANISRVVLDDKLSRFEYELGESGTETEDSDRQVTDQTDQTDHPDSSRRRSGRVREWSRPLRRTKSEERVSSRESSRGQSEFTPIQISRSSSSRKRYGAIAEEEEDSEPQLESGIHWERRYNIGLATQHGVAMVANTFARELLTFGKPKVHEGFIEAYMSLRKQVMGTLVELYRGRQRADIESGEIRDEEGGGIAESLPLFFCGHSLGGALATFASYEAARYFKRIGLRRRHDVSCTTFGCPRIGNEAFKARYERLVETHWRFEIASDPIPKVPIVPLNYVAVGVRVLMDQSGTLLIDPSFIEVQWWGLLGNLYLGYRLHIRASYFMALRTYCKLYKNGTDDLHECFWPFPCRVQTRGLFHHAHR